MSALVEPSARSCSAGVKGESHIQNSVSRRFELISDFYSRCDLVEQTRTRNRTEPRIHIVSSRRTCCCDVKFWIEASPHVLSREYGKQKRSKICTKSGVKNGVVAIKKIFFFFFFYSTYKSST